MRCVAIQDTESRWTQNSYETTNKSTHQNFGATFPAAGAEVASARLPRNSCLSLCLAFSSQEIYTKAPSAGRMVMIPVEVQGVLPSRTDRYATTNLRTYTKPQVRMMDAENRIFKELGNARFVVVCCDAPDGGERGRAVGARCTAAYRSD